MRGKEFSASYLAGEVLCLDKMIFSVGITLVCLGLSFLMVPYLGSSLHNAFPSGGYLWLVVGGLTAGFGLKVKHQKKRQLGALR